MLAIVTCGLAGLAVVAARAGGQPAAASRGEPLLSAPGTIKAEDARVEHVGGLGNLPGWWAFWGNGSLSVTCRVTKPGLYKVAVRAAGTTALNPQTKELYPRMVVEVDGGSAGRETFDVRGDRKTPEICITPALRLAAGPHAIRVAYVNDYGFGQEDRNLFVDWVGMGPVFQKDGLPALSAAEAWVRRAQEPVAPSWTFSQAGRSLGWRACEGSELAATAEGLRLRTAPTATGRPDLVSPRIEADARQLDCVSIVMKIHAGQHAELGWFVSGQPGLLTRSFPVIADGQFHVYTVELDREPSWRGKIIGLVLRPSGVAGQEAIVRVVKLADGPAGPAEIRLAEFDLEDAMNRAGRDATLVARLTNVGGQPARDVTVALALPAGVRLVEGRAARRFKAVAESAEITWRVRADAPATGAARLTVTGSGLLTVKAATRLEITASPAFEPTIVDGHAYVPQPRPVASDYLVGSYYFPGWRSGTHLGWKALRDYPERKPVLGWYEEGEPEVADWHIKWAVEHGISFFAYDWYWDRGRRQLEHALHDGFFHARYRNLLKFCLLWANHNPPGSSSEEDLTAVTRCWLANYFLRPEYLKIDNRPVVIIFSPHRMTSDMGAAAVKRSLERMRAMCRAAGLGGLYLIGCSGPSRNDVAVMKEEGYDAVSGYNYPSAGMEPGVRVAPYDSAIKGYEKIWQTIAGFGQLDYIALTEPGWDARPWHGDDTIVRTGRHPEKYQRMLELARAFADAHPIGASRQRIVLTEAWNEYGEGAEIEPQREFGFGYLEAIRSVFAKDATAHADVIPQDVGRPVKPWPPEIPHTQWEFNTDGDAEGWSALMGLEHFAVRGGVMRAHTINGDPAFACPVDFNAARYPAAAIAMKLSKGTRGQLFWSVRGAQETEATSLSFATTADGKFHEYRLDLKAIPTWRRKITRLRLDPNSDLDSDVEVDYIRLLEQP
jgi:hypothetical protein